VTNENEIELFKVAISTTLKWQKQSDGKKTIKKLFLWIRKAEIKNFTFK